MENYASGSGIRSQAWSELYQKENLYFPHYSVTEHNLQDEPSINGRVRFPFDCKHHLPYIPPNSVENIGTGLYHGDPATLLTHRKAHWTQQIGSLVKRNKQYENTYSTIVDALTSNCNKVSMPHHSAHFLHLLSQDPDSDFTGVTNWYYTGGRLSQLVVDNQLILLSTSGHKNESLYGIPLKLLPEKGWVPILDATITITPPDNEVIYQLVGKYTHNLSLIGTRQRNVCTIYTLQPTENCLNLKGVHQATSNKPLMSIDISEHNIGQYCTSSTNRQISLWDALSCACLSSDLVDRPKYDLTTPWCTTQFLDHHLLLMADSCSLNFLDTRLDLKKPSMVFYPKDQPSLLNSCEDISEVFPSSYFSSNFYIGTSHHLLELDARAFKTTQRWTHMMRSPPLYSQAMATQQSEIICIANQEPAEVEVITNNLRESKETTSQASILPYLLPTLRETLTIGHTRGQLLDPRVQKRLKVALTGLLCLPVENGIPHQILTQTSLGDIFVQELKPTRENKSTKAFYSPDDIDCFNEWENKALEGSITPILKVTGKVSYTKTYDNLVNPEVVVQPYSVDATLQQSLQSSKSELKSYTDLLAQDLLSAWDIEKVPEWGDECEELEESSVEVVDCTTVEDDNDIIVSGNNVTLPSVDPVSNESVLFTSAIIPEQMESIHESQDIFQVKDKSVHQLKPNNPTYKSPGVTSRRKSNVSGF